MAVNVDYGKYRDDERPFATEGLSVREILCLYRESRDKRSEIKILSELCGTDQGKMKKLLVAKGMEIPERRKAWQGGPDLEVRLGGEVVGTLEWIKGELDKGRSFSKICKKMGETPEAVKKLCNKYGLNMRLSPAEKAMKHMEDVERGRELAAKGMTAADAGLMLGVTACTARQWALEGGYRFAKPPRRNARHG